MKLKFKSLVMAVFLCICAVVVPFSVVKADSGGVPSICHYYDDGRLEKYTFRCYNDMGIRGIFPPELRPLGSHVCKTVCRSHRLFQDAKNAVDAFDSSISSARNNLIGFAGATVLEASSLASKNIKVTAEAAAGMALEAYMTTDAWLDAKEALRKAYDYINHM